MGVKDVALKKYFSDNCRFIDLINGIAFKGRKVFHVDEIKGGDTNSVYRENKKAILRQRDIIKKVGYGTESIYIACENQMEIHHGMPIRTILYDGLTYNEQLYERKKILSEKKDWDNSSEFLSGIKENDKVMAVITFVCYYGEKEWNSNLSLKDIVHIPEKYQDLDAYLIDYRFHLVPMMKLDPDVFHSEVRELIALLQCNSDIQKIEALIKRDNRCRYLSEETFEVFMVLSDEKASLRKLKKHAKCEQDRKAGYDMCRAFEQLRARGREEGLSQGIAQGERKLNQLYSFLFSSKRYDDLERAMIDEDYRQKLYEEMQIA